MIASTMLLGIGVLTTAAEPAGLRKRYHPNNRSRLNQSIRLAA